MRSISRLNAVFRVSMPPFEVRDAFSPLLLKPRSDAREYLVSRAAAGEHLTDRLLLPLALAGAGSFTAEKINMPRARI
jgi:hypothetical protein